MSPMKRTRMNRSKPLSRGPSRARKEKAAKARERYADGFGIYFDELRLHLPDSPKDWPKPRIVDDADGRQEYRFTRGLWCVYCDDPAQDLHHLVGGSRGRCDSWANLLPLCRVCHERIQSVPSENPELLRMKCRHDKPCTSWVRLTLLRGSWWPFDTLD
jgi:hypothetical protein